MILGGGTATRSPLRTRCGYSLRELAHVAGASPTHLRGWLRHGLLPRMGRGSRRAFSFRELARIRLLMQLQAHGLSPARIARSVRAARSWGADQDAALAALLEAPGSRMLAIRRADGGLVEPHGQRLFEFDAGAPAAAVHVIRSPQEWFELGVDAEFLGRLDHAVRAYQRSLPEVGAPAWFNLGNCRAELGDERGAIAAFEQAIAADPAYAAAWNNLGIVLGARHRHGEALQAFRRALDLAPHYADAHYNLAEALAATGDRQGAHRHWRAYLAYDPNSRWAEYVRRRLQDHGAG